MDGTVDSVDGSHGRRTAIFAAALAQHAIFTPAQIDRLVGQFRSTRHGHRLEMWLDDAGPGTVEIGNPDDDAADESADVAVFAESVADWIREMRGRGTVDQDLA